MKRFILLLIIVSPILCTGQDALWSDLEAASEKKISPAQQSHFSEFLHQLKSKKSGSDRAFLFTVFRKTQQKFLKTYTQYADFSEVFSAGRYDCLTATALYSLVLKELEISFDVFETNYHIFILAHLEKGDVLLETTDRVSGFVESDTEIRKRIASYQQQPLATGSQQVYFEYSCNLFQRVELSHLPGLLYLNRAVKAYNNHDLLIASSYLDRSIERCESPRSAELAVVILQSVLEGNYDLEVKYSVLQRYKKYLVPKGGPLASR